MSSDSDPPKHDAWPAHAPEMQEVVNNSLSVDSPPAPERERRRVRINSSAAEIPGAPTSYSHVSDDVEAQEKDSLENLDESTAEANDLLNAHRHGDVLEESDYPSAGTATQIQSSNNDTDEYAYSGNTQGGVFYQLLQAYKAPAATGNWSTSSNTPPRVPESVSRPGSSGAATPRKKWYNQEKANRSQETLATLIGAAQQLANPKTQGQVLPHKRKDSNPIMAKIRKAKDEQDTRIKIHVATILKRQQYIIKMCRALMLVGAPSHRLEEYLATTAKVLDINSQFLYIPGCMIISFDDPRKLF